MAAVRGGVSAPECTKERAGEDEELTTNSFWGLVWAGDDRRGGSTVRAELLSMEAWSFDFRRLSQGEARLEVGEGGGGGGELLCARDRSKATGGRRSMGGGRQGRAQLGSV